MVNSSVKIVNYDEEEKLKLIIAYMQKEAKGKLGKECQMF